MLYAGAKPPRGLTWPVLVGQVRGPRCCASVLSQNPRTVEECGGLFDQCQAGSGRLGRRRRPRPARCFGHQARKRQRIQIGILGPGGSGSCRWHQSMPSSAPSRSVDAHRRVAVSSADRQPPHTAPSCLVAATGSSGGGSWNEVFEHEGGHDLSCHHPSVGIPMCSVRPSQKLPALGRQFHGVLLHSSHSPLRSISARHIGLMSSTRSTNVCFQFGTVPSNCLIALVVAAGHPTRHLRICPA